MDRNFVWSSNLQFDAIIEFLDLENHKVDTNTMSLGLTEHGLLTLKCQISAIWVTILFLIVQS